MTKEEILFNKGALHVINDHKFYTRVSVLDAMQSYSDQTNAKLVEENERLKAEVRQLEGEANERQVIYLDSIECTEAKLEASNDRIKELEAKLK